MRVIRWKTTLGILLICVGLLVLVLGAVNATVIRKGRARVSTDFSADNVYDCILVLGAGLRSDGSPSDMLRDRLRGAVELYRRGVSDRVFLSGDRSGEDYDEVSAMAEYCLAEGIPEEAIVRDFEGYSTYESVTHAVREHGYRSMVIVTQEYHLYRAVYIAERLGADVAGFAADYRDYWGQSLRDAREVVARNKDFWLTIFS